VAYQKRGTWQLNETTRVRRLICNWLCQVFCTSLQHCRPANWGNFDSYTRNWRKKYFEAIRLAA